MGILMVVAALLPATAFGINKLTPVYMFGFSFSFNDSTVYFSEIQKIDSTWIDSRTHFLYGRDEFASQLSSFLKSNENPNPTTTVIFANDRKNIEKKYVKLKKRYTTKENYTIKYVDINTFSFQHVVPNSPEITYTKAELKAAIKKEKADIKQKNKAAKQKAKATKKEQKAKKEKAMAEAKQRARELKKSRQ